MLKILVPVVFSTLLILCPSVQASDHIDGVPSLDRHQQVDLTDLYAFPTPHLRESLTVILNLYPGVSRKGHFSSKVDYSIFVVGATIAGEKTDSSFLQDENQEFSVFCQFTDSDHHHTDLGTVQCTFDGVQMQSPIQIAGDVGELIETPVAKLFTGAKADPFFFGVRHFRSVTHRQDFPEPIRKFQHDFSPLILDGNLMEGLNILTIALEIDLKSVLPQQRGSIYTLAAQSSTTELGKLEVLDRIGRPEITNLSLHDYEGTAPVKRRYNSRSARNLESPFDPRPQAQGYFEPFRNRLEENILAYDKLDKNEEWTNSELFNPMVSLLLDDFLVVDISKSCDPKENKFFEIERSLLKGREHDTCGGRQLTDDIWASLYALYIGGVTAKPDNFKTGIDRPYQSSTRKLKKEFPYMAKPWSWSWVKWPLRYFLLNKGKDKQQRE